MWAFSEVIDGMAEACKVFETPVVSGNVSFYNETDGRGILPTPVIGMVGILDDARRVVQQGFKQSGDLIALIGATADDLSASAYAQSIQGKTTAEIVESGIVPFLNFEIEKAVQNAVVTAAELGLLRSAHDCSDGGLAVALAECCFSSLNRKPVGAIIKLTAELSATAALFSESPSRIIISLDRGSLSQIEEIAARFNAPFVLLGEVGGENLSIEVNQAEVVLASVNELENAWRGAIETELHNELLVGVFE